VTTQSLDPGLAAQLGLSVKQGALVVSVSPSTPAAGTPLRAGDVIVAFDGTAIDSSDALGAAIGLHRPGDRVTVVAVAQAGNRITFQVTLGVRPLPTNP